MPVFQRGDMWSAFDDADLFLITTNSTLKGNGALVMGRGIAKQARDRWPGLDLALGEDIGGGFGSYTCYSLMVSMKWPKAKLGAFQVKTYYNKPASLFLIERAVQELFYWCDMHPGARVELNFPGIGNGGLRREDVLPLLEKLPNNVTIWEFAAPKGNLQV